MVHLEKQYDELSIKLKKYIKALATAPQVNDPDMPLFGIESFDIPDDMMTKELKSKPIFGFRLTQDETVKFRELLHTLRPVLEFEYLSDKELRAALIRLSCKICLDRQSFLAKRHIETEADGFLKGLVQPIRSVRVVFGLNSLETEKAIECEYGKITKLHESLFDENMDEDLKAVYGERLRARIGKTVVLVEESGNNYQRIHDRARESALHVLRIVRVGLSNISFMHEQQLLFDLDGYAFLLDADSNELLYGMWQRPRDPWRLQFNEPLALPAQEYVDLLREARDIGGSAYETTKRALIWMSDAIQQSEYDHKVISLCTALETILTFESDGLKGQAIAFRQIMLGFSLNENYFHPDEILRVYELRSALVHGSELRISTTSDWTVLHYICRKTLELYIKLSAKLKTDDHVRIVNSLHTSELTEKCKDLLEAISTKASQSVLSALVSLEEKQSVS